MAKERRYVYYEFIDERGRVTVQFIRIAKERPAPGFTHRVFAEGYAGYRWDWLSATHKPNLRSARYFYEKYAEAVAAGQTFCQPGQTTVGPQSGASVILAGMKVEATL